ncbi:Cyclic pyranopterin monophosphate synthase [bioreactor metagenome]|uniref:cyclic pyranopterin monophosphate synthase n=1 Tax=bioreactor metagenome TaxID=1076179 RepID=A0A644THA0_9ZZZZ|nr:cyclic pyranopterin monophosphate synthase MoaC [Negativicutes bacterium]
MGFTHFNEDGRARMVDVSEKNETIRIASAQAVVKMQPSTLQAIKTGGIKKGDVLGVAQVAGVMGAKRTAELIPMCHPLLLTSVNVTFDSNEDQSEIVVKCQVKTTGKTGVEMEALSGASIAALTIYDMCKAIDRWMSVTQLQLVEKTGGKSGHIVRPS